MIEDEARVATLARETLGELELRAASAPPPDVAERVRRAMGAVPRWLQLKLSGLLREHWDVGLFDVTFGALKAFGAYPALYFAGLAWTIPLMETSLLNTQLWTAAYLVVRRRLRGVLGGRRFGVSLERLDALRERRLGLRPRDARIHRFQWEGRSYCVRVRPSRLGAWVGRLCGRLSEPGVVVQAQLRGMLRDAELRHLAEPLRRNPYLYEELLLARLLSQPDEREALFGVAVPEDPLGPEDESLRLAIGEGRAATRARLEAQGDALRQALRNLPSLAASSPAAVCLRWLGASLVRRVARTLRELETLEYALLADLYRGAAVPASPAAPSLARARERLADQLARIDSLVARVHCIRSPGDACRLALRGLEETRAAGIPARRAGLVAHLLPNPVSDTSLACRLTPGRAR
jgi:hypothetical protein